MANQRSLVKLATYLEDQGCNVRPTPQGWFIQFPGGGLQSLHRSPGDRRWLKNFRASVLRAGIEWPEKIGKNL